MRCFSVNVKKSKVDILFAALRLFGMQKNPNKSFITGELF